MVPGKVARCTHVGVVMSRGTAVAMAFVVVGGLGTAMMGRWDAFSIGFSFLFWGGLAAAITWIAGGRWSASESDVLPKLNPATGLPMLGNLSHGWDLEGNTYGTTDASDAMASVDHPHPGAHGGL